MFKLLCNHPDINGIRSCESDDDTERHHAPEDQLQRVHRAHIAAHHQKRHQKTHPGHHGVHADEFREKRTLDVFKIRSTHHFLHEQRLEDEQAEDESRGIFHDWVEPHGEAKGSRNDCGKDDARSVARDAVDRTANSLFPERTNEVFMCSGPWLLVGEYIEQKTKRTHV